MLCMSIVQDDISIKPETLLVILQNYQRTNVLQIQYIVDLQAPYKC